MTLTDKDIVYLEKSWKNVPIAVLADKYGLGQLELLKVLRQKGVLKDIHPVEEIYIRKNIESVPAKVIQDNLGLTYTQFSQICQKKLQLKQVKSLSEWTIYEVIQKTQWLIEKRLKVRVDDALPKKIRNKHFVENHLYPCIRFAEYHKNNDGYYQHFSATAFCVCHTYPDRYRPFQFPHAKKNPYFSGREGKKNLINAVRWILENKLEVEPEYISTCLDNKYFLRTKDLEWYGVGAHWYRKYFSSKQELVNELAKRYGVEKEVSSGHSTTALRRKLEKNGIPIDKCYVENCFYDNEYGIEVHHIVPKEYKHMTSIDIHSAQNLIPLCPNHHKISNNDFHWKQLMHKPPMQWRRSIAEFLSAGK